MLSKYCFAAKSSSDYFNRGCRRSLSMISVSPTVEACWLGSSLEVQKATPAKISDVLGVAVVPLSLSVSLCYCVTSVNLI